MQLLREPTDSARVQTVDFLICHLLLMSVVNRRVEEGVGYHLSDVALASVCLVSRDKPLCYVLLSDELLEPFKFIL